MRALGLDDYELILPTDDVYTGGGILGLALVVIVASVAPEATSKKPPNLPSKKKVELDMDHIASGHMPGGDRNPDGKKSVFWGMTYAQVVKAVYEAYETSSKLQTQGDRIRLIGFSGSFNMFVEMWINIVTKIIETAYPK